MLFNASASPHGAGFGRYEQLLDHASSDQCAHWMTLGLFALCRFPEELNGVGCYGASFLRGLAGAGYVLQWPLNNTVHARVTAHASSGRVDSSLSQTSHTRFDYDGECRCVSSVHSEKLADMVTHMNK